MEQTVQTDAARKPCLELLCLDSTRLEASTLDSRDTITKLLLADFYCAIRQEIEPRIYDVLEDGLIKPRDLADYFCLANAHKIDSLRSELEVEDNYKALFCSATGAIISKNISDATQIFFSGLKALLGIKGELEEYIKGRHIYKIFNDAGIENAYFLAFFNRYEKNPNCQEKLSKYLARAKELNPSKDYRKLVKHLAINAAAIRFFATTGLGEVSQELLA